MTRILLCDFCNKPDVVYTYEAKKGSNWCACADCADRIEALDHQGLHTLSVASYIHKDPTPEGVQLTSICMEVIHEVFWQVMTGRRWREDHA